MPEKTNAELVRSLMTLHEVSIKEQNKTNESIQKLADSVTDLVLADRDRVNNDKRQQEINAELSEKVKVVDSTINTYIKENGDTMLTSKKLHQSLNKIYLGISVAVALGIAKLLGFSF